ncbi:MAG: hypothetical protein JWN44_939 [Myxococcales bacterium]|nr:hypothetical protein [Myxococcales bacterium]
MTRTSTIVAMVLIPVAAGAGGSPGDSTRPHIDPRADALVHRMSAELASLRSFRVDADAADEVVLRSGQKLQELSQSHVAVKRPNRLRAERVGTIADVVLRYDGDQLSLFGNRTAMYATAHAPPTLDGAINYGRDRLGLEAPAADLLFSRPYDVLMDGVSSGEYVGLEPVDGVPCHHLAFRAAEVDWQIWIEDGPHPLPRRYVITSKTELGSPEFTVRLSHWDPQASLPDSLFSFAPPAGATKIDFLPSDAGTR